MRFIRTSERAAFFVLTVLGVALYALYFVHLRADYPRTLPLIDWARYTDEGWYGGAALHHAQTGQWFTPGVINHAVALPLWPLLLRAWFALTGPGMVAARVLNVLLLGGTNLLLFSLLRPHTGRVLAIAAVLLTLANPFCYGFDRMAILEPLVAFLFLLALHLARPHLAAQSMGSGYGNAAALETPAHLRHDNFISTGARALHAHTQSANLAFAQAVVIGLLILALILTKTTAVLLAPAILYLLYQNERGDRRWILPAIAASSALTASFGYFLAVVRLDHLTDFHHLFIVNAGKAHGRILLQVMARALGDATWMGPILWALTLLLLAASLRYLRELWRIPLFTAAALALVLPIAFIGWHTWFIPHYYLPCIAPMIIVLALGLRALARRANAPAASRTARFIHTTAMAAVEAAFAFMLFQTLHAASHPRYTLANAAEQIAATMRASSPPDTNPKLLASSADTIALFTGIRSANPEWPTAGLPVLLRREQPQWYGAYLPWDAARVQHIQTELPLQEVARYEIQPDAQHQVFVLYRVLPVR